jgi:hypothetical protein
MATYQQRLNQLTKQRDERLNDLKVSGPNVWVDKGKKISITLVSYGLPSCFPFDRGTTFSIKRTNSEAERTRLMFNYPSTPPADDGFTYYISCNLNKRFQGCINVYASKDDAAILSEKFKSLPAWAIDAAE